ncbi:MAG TPA: MFS transporter, partial [Rhodanobacteraceae bacterium]|nr:MFS transporter [Rhodanobacteraceae bacterium]
RHDRRVALSLVAAATALLALAALWLGGHGVVAMTVIFLVGGTSFAVYPIVVAHLADHADPGELLAASSSVLLVYGVGSAVGPLVAGGTMSLLGPWSLFAWFALTHALLAAYAAWRCGALRRVPVHERKFRPMLRTTPAALRLLRNATHPGRDP